MLPDIPFAMNDVITDQFILKLVDILILMFCYHATDITLSHSYVLRKFGRLTTRKSPKFGTYNFECLILKWRISLSSERILAILIKNLRPRLHEYVFIENPTIVLHLHIVFISPSYCSLWRPFSKVIVFSRFRVGARGKRKEKFAVSMKTI